MNSWIEQLQPIIDEYSEGEPLDADEVRYLYGVLEAKINLHQSNITEEEYNTLIDENITLIKTLRENPRTLVVG